MDHAICPGLNVGFSNWRSIMRAVERQAGGVDVITETVIEALAVHVFMEDGKMTDTWLLRCDSALLSGGQWAGTGGEDRPLLTLCFPMIVSEDVCFCSTHTHSGCILRLSTQLMLACSGMRVPQRRRCCRPPVPSTCMPECNHWRKPLRYPALVVQDGWRRRWWGLFVPTDFHHCTRVITQSTCLCHISRPGVLAASKSKLFRQGSSIHCTVSRFKLPPRIYRIDL